MGNNELVLDGDSLPVTDTASGKRYFVRLNRAERLQHMIFAACYIVLVISGFMLKVPDKVVLYFGQFGETVFSYRSLLHRTAGIVMIIVCAYHVYYLIFKAAGRRWLIDMLPRPKDLWDMRDNFLYFIHVKKEPPEFDRFCYKHKIEYGALIAGTTIVSVTGLIL
jgi:cytochrome b subunit of formate dehydrogenase